MTRALIAFTVIFGVLFLWSLWAWRGARPASPQAFSARNNVLLSVAFLLTLAPRLMWPADSGLVLVVGSLAIVPFTLVVLALLRRRQD